MREIWNFLAWQWRKFEFWQKCFIFSSFFFGAALVADPPWTFYFSLVPMIVVGSFLFKWAVIDGTRSAWQRYQAEKMKLLKIIKDSEC